MNGVEIWDQINETVKILVWPGVAAGAIWMFRAKLGGLFSRLREADTPAGKITFDPAREEVRLKPALDRAEDVMLQAVLNATTVTFKDVDSVDPTNVVRLQGSKGDAEASEGSSRQSPSLQEVREQIEEMIQSAFEAGVLAGRGGEDFSQHTPRPVIEWQGAEPYVAGWTVTPHGPDYFRPAKTMVAREWIAVPHSEYRMPPLRTKADRRRSGRQIIDRINDLEERKTTLTSEINLLRDRDSRATLDDLTREVVRETLRVKEDDLAVVDAELSAERALLAKLAPTQQAGDPGEGASDPEE